MAVHSVSPTLYRRKLGFGSGVFAFRTGAGGLCWLRTGGAGVCWLSAGATTAKLLSRPNADAATAADRITSRREVVGISGPPEISRKKPPQPARVRMDILRPAATSVVATTIARYPSSKPAWPFCV